ncbi:Fic family protein [Candidatus Giovannonibacteria bacterium]|nr:Fic family protein [Candidatus Giovannonibacteria bacterium]
MLGRPRDEKEKQLFDAVGTIRAARFVRRYAKTRKPINIGVVYDVHREIYFDWWPEVAGKIREEEVTIWHSEHLPPHHSKIREHMQSLQLDLQDRLAKIDFQKLSSSSNETDFVEFTKLVAFIHHKIVWIHPFIDGNGRTARLMANLLLERYGLWGISAQIERENKEAYFNALSQIDDYDDYEPLMEIIIEGLLEKANKLSSSIRLPRK